MTRAGNNANAYTSSSSSSISSSKTLAEAAMMEALNLWKCKLVYYFILLLQNCRLNRKYSKCLETFDLDLSLLFHWFQMCSWRIWELIKTITFKRNLPLQRLHENFKLRQRQPNPQLLSEYRWNEINSDKGCFTFSTMSSVMCSSVPGTNSNFGSTNSSSGWSSPSPYFTSFDVVWYNWVRRSR